jgi:hypothetical protein
MERTTCVEVSALHCTVLRAKGFGTVHGDFLRADKLGSYSRVVMNPPFDRGQWVAHVEHAAKLCVGAGARLVAVLPSGAPNKLRELPGFSLAWSEPIHGAFAGTNVSVVILTADRKGSV